ncbi:hypothetical protein GCM10009613_30900 [Pseudonocardia kongjuensis]|uniref:Uncharacterized protein n=1 Tax=Pseudonocardia kongjuensis TaxID=102227 RepID=A0ABP4IGP5_9PSEU
MPRTTYRFRVEGDLPAHAVDEFCDMRIEAVPASTILECTVVDESHLRGIFALMRSLGLTVVSARPVRR